MNRHRAGQGRAEPDMAEPGRAGQGRAGPGRAELSRVPVHSLTNEHRVFVGNIPINIALFLFETGRGRPTIKPLIVTRYSVYNSM